MANAVYTVSFKSLHGVTAGEGDDYTLEIWSKAVNTNPAIPIKCSGTPIKINWRTVTDVFEPVITSEAVVEVISETDLQWKDFFTATRGAWILKVIREGVIIWQGQNITESYNEPYLGTPYKSTLRFSDLGDMDFIYYQPTSTTFYSGYQSLAEIIFRCTNKLEFQLDANEYTNCTNLETWNDASITEKSLLCNTYLDASVFRLYENEEEKAMTCMEVLKTVLRSISCRMFQAHQDGVGFVSKWHIQKLDEMIDSDVLYTFGLDHSTYAVSVSNYLSNFKRYITNGTDFTADDITPVDQNQQLNMSERFSQVNYKYTTKELYRQNAELLVNGTFDKGVYTNNNTSKFPKYFQCSTDLASSNAAQVIKHYDYKSGKYGADKDLEFRAYNQSVGMPAMPGMLAAQGTSASTIVSTGSQYIRTTGTESGDTVDAQTKIMSNVQVSVQDNLKLTIKGQIYKFIDYFIATVQGTNNENYLTSEVFHVCAKVILTYANGNKYTWYVNPTYPGYGQNMWTKWNGTPYATGDNIIHRIIGSKGFENNVNAATKYYNDDFNIELTSDTFPENGIGSFSFWFYVPRTETAYGQPIGLAALTLDTVSLQYVTDGDFSDDVLKISQFYSLTDGKANIYDCNVAYGDGPADICLSSFRYGVVSAADQYKMTSSWRKIDVSTARTAANMFCFIPAARLITSYQRIISGDYIGIFGFMDTLNIDDGTADKKYLLMGDSWDVKACIHSITMQEITDPSTSISSTSTSITQFPGGPVAATSSKVSSKSSAIFSGKLISNSVVLTPPVKLNPTQIQTTYPG